VLILWYQNCGTAAGRLGKIEKFTNGVWCKAFNVENCKGKTCRHIGDNDIKVEYSKYDFFMQLVWFF
jgi:hypothetical protein